MEHAALVLTLLLQLGLMGPSGPVPPSAAAKPEAKPGSNHESKPAPSKPRAAADPRAAVEQLLRSAGGAPGASALAAIGRNVDELLVAIARDPSVDVPVRTRAVGALAQTPTPVARAFLYGLVGDPNKALASSSKRKAAAVDAGSKPEDVARVLQRRGAVSLGWIGGSAAPGALGPLLESPDAEVRADAAMALAITRLPRAAELLRARLPVETDPRVRAHIARQINVIDGALGLYPPPPVPANQGPPARAEF